MQLSSFPKVVVNQTNSNSKHNSSDGENEKSVGVEHFPESALATFAKIAYEAAQHGWTERHGGEVGGSSFQFSLASRLRFTSGVKQVRFFVYFFR